MIVYTFTMAPDILSHDLAEWQAAGITLGIVHAPGSPSYILISHFFSWLPFGLPAARITFLSVTMGAAGVTAVYAFVFLLFRRALPALIAAVSLAVAAIWWGNSAVATPYNAMVTIPAFLLILLLLWSRSGNIKLVWAGAVLTGLGLGYHPNLLFFLPVIIAGLFWLGPWRPLIQPKVVLTTILMGLAGMSTFLYLPIRSAENPTVSYQKIDSLSTFYEYVSASQARQSSLRESLLPGLNNISDRFNEVVLFSYHSWFMVLVFVPTLLLLLPPLWPQFRVYWRWLVFLAAAMIVHVFLIFVLSDVYDHYYLPMLLYVSIWTGISVLLIMSLFDILFKRGWLKWISKAAIGALYLGVLAAGLPHAWEFADHSEDRSMRAYANYVFSQANHGAVVLANWESYTGMLYLQKVEGQRTDISLYSVPVPLPDSIFSFVKNNHPDSQILISRSFNISDAEQLRNIRTDYPLSLKGGTYQDFNHGKPFPIAAQLFRETASGQFQ
ncbi:MAG: protein O-mannosyl-transferase family [Thermoleophilia bacterium]